MKKKRTNDNRLNAARSTIIRCIGEGSGREGGREWKRRRCRLANMTLHIGCLQGGISYTANRREIFSEPLGKLIQIWVVLTFFPLVRHNQWESTIITMRIIIIVDSENVCNFDIVCFLLLNKLFIIIIKRIFRLVSNKSEKCNYNRNFVWFLQDSESLHLWVKGDIYNLYLIFLYIYNMYVYIIYIFFPYQHVWYFLMIFRLRRLLV